MTKFTSNRFLATAFGTSALVALGSMATADQVIVDDLIVQGSACIGEDCVNGESFGFDTIRLKENNLRIKAQDTSSTASFASVDWQITFNESTNGGANKFSIDNVDTGRTPFTIMSGAQSNAIYVSDQSKVGFGTSSPAVELHAVGGNSPTLRLEQDGSAGFTAQTFDIAANETNFFVRDVTNGSRLPFKIIPGADTGTLTLAANNSVGMGLGGDNTPDASLHIRRTDGTVKLLIEEASSTAASRELMKMSNNGGSYITMTNTSTGNDWFVTHENAAAGRFIIARGDGGPKGMFLGADGSFQVGGTGTPATGGMVLASNGNLTIGGSLSQSSDKNAKVGIQPINPQEVLQKVAALPVSSWTYIHDASTGTRHIGPMAQDFHAAFGTGANDTTISTLDTSGVALAAIQALTSQNAEQQVLIAQLSARIDTLDSHIKAD